MKNSHIEWTDHTFNPWEGCTKVSPGCAHCYAEARNQRFAAGANWGKGAPRRRTSEANWKQPLAWNRTAICKCGGAELIGSDDCRHCEENFNPATRRRPRVFCASLADWLDDEVPIEWLADLLDLIRRTPNLDWLLLTKRPGNWKARLLSVAALEDQIPLSNRGVFVGRWFQGFAPANVWIGTSVEDQQRADERIPVLLSIPAKVRFISCEPLLGMVVLKPLHYPVTDKGLSDGIHWVICGGESGSGARPMHPDWARSLRVQCRDAGVAFFFKQWGEWAPSDGQKTKGYFHGFRDGQMMEDVGKKNAGRLLDGIEHNAVPGTAS